MCIQLYLTSPIIFYKIPLTKMFSRIRNAFISFAPFFILLSLLTYIFVSNPGILFGGSDKKITICHATESDSNTFVKIVVAEEAYKAHFENPGAPLTGHEKDFFFEGDVDCPSLNPSVNPTNTITSSPTVSVTINPDNSLCKSQNAECDINATVKECCGNLKCTLFNGVSGNAKCLPEGILSPTPSDIPTGLVTPTLTVYPTTNPGWSNNEKWTICHATSSDVHPYSKITVSKRSDHGHFDENGNPENGHENDLIFFGEVDCPNPTITPTTTPHVCDLEYSCIECMTLSISDTCFGHKERYCMHNFNCGYLHSKDQCVIGGLWRCNCEIPTPTTTGTPTITPVPSNLGLVIDKTNKVTGDIGRGEEFIYEISVINTGTTSFIEVNVKDVLPGGFSYVNGSSYVDGILISDPSNVGGMLTFNIGALPLSVTKILNYKVKAIDEDVGGSYYNLAFAIGKYDSQNEQKSYESATDNSKVVMGRGRDYSAKVGGEVLGTSTSRILPATGSNIALTLIVLTVLLIITTLYKRGYIKIGAMHIDKYLKRTLIAILPGIIFITLASSVFAVSDTVYIQDLPEYVTSEGFKLSYSALSNSSVTARFYIRKDGDSSWRQFGGTLNGFSGWVQMGGSEVYSGDGKYYFKVEMNGGSAYDETNTIIDRGSPNPVSDYRKEKVAGGFYKLYWRIPDNEDFSRVFIYRSTDRNFTADGTTKAGEVGGSRNTNVIWENVGLDASKDYYYAVRAVDKAGNASGLVSDPETSIIVGTAASISTEEEVLIYPTQENVNENDTEQSGDVLAESNNYQEKDPGENIAEKVVQFAKDRTKITLGIVLAVALVGLYILKSKKGSGIKKIGTKK